MSSIPGKPVDQDKGGEGATSGLEAGVRRHDHERSSDILEKNDIMARAGAACSIVNASPPRSQGRSHGHSMGFGDDSSDERPRSPHSYHDRSSHRSKDRSRHRSLSRSFERRRPQFHPQDNDSRLPSPYQDEMMQRLKKLEQLERKEDVVEPEELLGEGKHPPRLIEENQDPIIIKDAVSRRLLLPFHLCKSLQVRASFFYPLQSLI